MKRDRRPLPRRPPPGGAPNVVRLEWRPRTDIVSDLPPDSDLRPQVYDVDGEQRLNIAFVLLGLYEANPDEVDPGLRLPTRRFQERVRASLDAQRLATGREPDLYRTLAACAGTDKDESTWPTTLEAALLGSGGS